MWNIGGIETMILLSNFLLAQGAPDILVEDKDSAVLLSDLCAESCYFPMNNNLGQSTDTGTIN